MSNFSKKHSLPTYEERKEAIKGRIGAARQKWLKADHIVDQVYCDLCNGFTKSDVLLKLTSAKYDGQDKHLSERTAYDYIAAAVDRLHFDMEAKQEELRADLYGKLMTVYQDAIEHSDRYSAIGALQTVMKLTGCAVPSQPQTAIQINNNTEGITINFGFTKEKELTDED